MGLLFLKCFYITNHQITISKRRLTNRTTKNKKKAHNGINHTMSITSLSPYSSSLSPSSSLSSLSQISESINQENDNIEEITTITEFTTSGGQPLYGFSGLMNSNRVANRNYIMESNYLFESQQGIPDQSSSLLLPQNLNRYESQNRRNTDFDEFNFNSNLNFDLNYDLDSMIPYQTIIQNCPDFTHILSSRGIILYVSPEACLSMTGRHAQEFIGHHISILVHPEDLIGLMREIKNATLNHSISVSYRIEFKLNSNHEEKKEWIWMDVLGHKYEMDIRKKTKCFILSGRRRPIDDLKVKDIIGLDQNSVNRLLSILGGDRKKIPRGCIESGLDDFWCKISLEGFILFIYHNPLQFFGMDHHFLYGKNILDLLDSSSKLILQETFKTVTSEHRTIEIHSSISQHTEFGSILHFPIRVIVYPQRFSPHLCIRIAQGHEEDKIWNSFQQERNILITLTERQRESHLFDTVDSNNDNSN